LVYVFMGNFRLRYIGTGTLCGRDCHHEDTVTISASLDT